MSMTVLFIYSWNYVEDMCLDVVNTFVNGALVFIWLNKFCRNVCWNVLSLRIMSSTATDVVKKVWQGLVESNV